MKVELQIYTQEGYDEKISILFLYFSDFSTLAACGDRAWTQVPEVDIGTPPETAADTLAYMDAQPATLHVNGSISVTFE